MGAHNNFYYNTKIDMHYLNLLNRHLIAHFCSCNQVTKHNHYHFLQDNIHYHQYKINYLTFKVQMKLSFFGFHIGN
jgi:hypothetical protein